jgi:hypothetical protein
MRVLEKKYQEAISGQEGKIEERFRGVQTKIDALNIKIVKGYGDKLE